MTKKLLTTDNARDLPSSNIALVQEYIGLDRAQFTSAFSSKSNFDKIFENNYWGCRLNFSWQRVR